MNELATKLLRYVQAEVCVLDIELTGDTDLLLTGAVDSLGVIRITQWLEDEAGIGVDPGDVTLENFQTVDRMLAYARRRRATV
ncbi:MAG: phosphopantetheine-binding protein [Acidimicrobiales bacterium]